MGLLLLSLHQIVNLEVEGMYTDLKYNHVHICACYREDLVKKLSEHIPIDVYGKCGTLECGTEWYNNDKSHDADQECMQMVNQTYKFYLSLENSVCEV